MAEQWFVPHIFLKPEAYESRDTILLDTIKPAVEALWKEKLIQTFHFLFEPNYEILFRVRLNEDASMERVKGVISERLTLIESLCVKIDSDENYHGEGDPRADWSFGTEGWRYMQKFLEYGSRITLLMREVKIGRKPITEGRLNSQFNVGKLVHCFLNQCGMDVVREAHFHIDAYFERMLLAFRYNEAIERLKKLEETNTVSQKRVTTWRVEGMETQPIVISRVEVKEVIDLGFTVCMEERKPSKASFALPRLILNFSRNG